MKALSQLVELFETDHSFRKEWKKDAISAIASRELMIDGTKRPWLQKFVHGLQNKKHLSKQPFLFGM